LGALQFVIELLKTISWPLVVLAVMFLFRGEIKALISEFETLIRRVRKIERDSLIITLEKRFPHELEGEEQ